MLRIEVTDTGCGIKSSDLHRGRLFSPFNQTELGKTQGGKGTGLGLTLVKQLVNVLGGRLGVRSQEGEGSTFWFELPYGVGASAMAVFQDPNSNIPDLANNLKSVYTTAMKNGDALPAAADAHATVVSQPLLPTLEDRQKAALNNLVDPTNSMSLQSKRDVASLRGSTGERPPSTAPASSARPSPALETANTEFALKPLSVIAKNEFELPTQKGQPSLPRDEDAMNNDITDAPGAAVTPLTRPTFLPMPATSFGSNMTKNTSLADFDAANSPGDSSSIRSSETPVLHPGLPVLVIEDDPINRQLLKRMLAKTFGCTVTTAENGQLGLDILLGHNPETPSSPGGFFTPGSEKSTDPILSTSRTNERPRKEFAIVFLDNQMPVKSGIDMVSELRDVHGRHDVFVVGVTGNAALEDQREFKSAGVNDVLAKPIKQQAIGRHLAAASERWSKRLMPAGSIPQAVPPDTGQ